MHQTVLTSSCRIYCLASPRLLSLAHQLLLLRVPQDAINLVALVQLEPYEHPIALYKRLDEVDCVNDVIPRAPHLPHLITDLASGQAPKNENVNHFLIGVRIPLHRFGFYIDMVCQGYNQDNIFSLLQQFF